MQNNRPKLTDPKEFAIIREIYFEKDEIRRDDIDPIEKWERMRSKNRNTNNQAR